jgi:hypothetical protein
MLAQLLEAQDLKGEALMAMSEAVGIRRTLARDTRLAGMLGDYADRLTRADRYWDAKNTLVDAVKIQRQSKSQRQRRRLGKLCRTLARVQVQLNMPHDAARAAAEAVATWRLLADESADDVHEFVRSLQDLAQICDILGRKAEAANATAEADEVQRRLAVDGKQA